jgi:hypothetical protein
VKEERNTPKRLTLFITGNIIEVVPSLLYGTYTRKERSFEANKSFFGGKKPNEYDKNPT